MKVSNPSSSGKVKIDSDRKTKGNNIMKKLINWIWSNKKEEVTPTWTPWEENERKYEELHKQLSMK